MAVQTYMQQYEQISIYIRQ